MKKAIVTTLLIATTAIASFTLGRQTAPQVIQQDTKIIYETKEVAKHLDEMTKDEFMQTIDEVLETVIDVNSTQDSNEIDLAIEYNNDWYEWYLEKTHTIYTK